jgi:hypothetical protein
MARRCVYDSDHVNGCVVREFPRMPEKSDSRLPDCRTSEELFGLLIESEVELEDVYARLA